MKNRFFASISAATAAIMVLYLAPAPSSSQGLTPAAKVKTTSAAKTWTPPLTPDGHPDLQGIWSNSTLTPLERPSQLAGKEFLTEKEAADYEKQLLQNTNRDRRDGGADADLGRAYNDAWYDSGTKIVKKRRTSLVIDPPDGKIPAFTPEAQKREDARAEERRRRAPSRRALGRTEAYRSAASRGAPPSFLGLTTITSRSCRLPTTSRFFRR